ncbi:energy-coupling factor transporter ATPase [Bulleidia sp. HCP3S3_F2]|uniref:energy-coupling factor transporter ATPase n=1 Tax=unclassified Bulleidia TaxID=2704656 RepID=UPI002A8FCB71|nr:energy-coupling factor transporter ATPase [Erysipelotrichaceae bacterium]MDD7058297.1 energy-coupling factor transporter ATPase [Erysipelotrichaceae bacterium]MDY3659722.1 energy-coupling factor transporter ATPase [Bulleidia sp.]
MAILEVKDLNFSYEEEGKTIDNVSFSVEEGSYTTIVGHNGSGKSTIAKLIMGLLESASGTITIDGIALNNENLAKIRSRIGIVFQNPDNQFIGATVRDDIAFGLENHCVEPSMMDEIIDTNAALVKMSDFMDQEPTHLSGGQKQRVAIAGVLAMKPKLLIFDEATSMLDPDGKDEIKKVIMKLHKESSLTILSITHDIDEVASSDYVVALDQGKVVLTGTPQEVFQQEKKLKEMKLDIPFSLKLADELKKRGVTVDRCITMEGMVNELCRLRSKM